MSMVSTSGTTLVIKCHPEIMQEARGVRTKSKILSIRYERIGT